MNSEEIAIIQRAQQGDAGAFELLVTKFDAQVMQIAYSMVGDKNDAQDVYQETFLRAFKGINSFRFQSSFRTWLTRIVINCAKDFRQSRFFRLRLGYREQFENADPEIKDSSPDQEREILSKEIDQMIKTGMQKLSHRERATFTLRHFHGFKIKEIADLLQCAEGTAKNYLFRATQKLQKHLAPYYADRNGD